MDEEKLEILHAIEATIERYRNTYCTYDCEECDNGTYYCEDCPIYRIIQSLSADSDSLLGE